MSEEVENIIKACGEAPRRVNLLLDAVEGIEGAKESLQTELGLTTEEMEKEMSGVLNRLIAGLMKEPKESITPRKGSLFLGYLDMLRKMNPVFVRVSKSETLNKCGDSHE